jgi:hypothetical protein
VWPFALTSLPLLSKRKCNRLVPGSASIWPDRSPTRATSHIICRCCLLPHLNLPNMLAFILMALSFTIPIQSQIDSTCTAFTSNGLASSTFLYYRFYDFRNVIGSSSASAQNSMTSKTVTDGSWTNDWYIRNYPRKSPGPPVIPVSFTPKRVSISMSPSTIGNLISD